MKNKLKAVLMLFVVFLMSISSIVYGCELIYSSSQIPVYKLDDLLICCIEKGAPIKGGSLQEGITTQRTYRIPANPLSGSTDSNVENNAVWNTPTYKCTSEEELDEVTSYILTSGVLEKGDYDVLQYAIWCNHNSIGGINRGNKVTNAEFDYTNIEAYKQAENICSEIDQRKEQILPELNKCKTELQNYINDLNNKLNDINSKINSAESDIVKENLQNQKLQIEQTIKDAENELNQADEKYNQEVNLENEMREKARVLIANAKEKVETIKNEGGKLFEEAIAYKNFHEQLTELGGYKVTDTTVHSNLKVVSNQKDHKYIVGPYSIDYLKGYTKSYSTGERVNFGGINKLYLIDQEGNKIEDVNIIMDDNGDEGYDFPNPNQEFYLSFDSNKYSSVKSVKLNAEFKYIETCTGKYHVFEGEGDIVSWSLKSEVIPNGRSYRDDEGKKHYEDVTEYYWQTEKTGTYKSQTLMGVIPDSKVIDVTETTIPGISLNAEGKVVVDIDACGYNAVRVINGKNLSDTNNPDDYLDLSMTLGGYVFLDTASGKIGEANGIKDENDQPLSGVTVTLYNEDGTIADLVQEDVAKPGLDSNNKQIRTNPTITDENGYYEFNGIDSRYKYYVGITYNGQTMTNTYYLLNKYNSVNDMVNSGLYNNENSGTSEEWMNSSKGTETSSERIDLNNRYSEIGSYPNCYTSTNSLGYGINQNKVYRYDELSEIYSLIEAKTRNWIINNKVYPNIENDIYSQVISYFNSDSEIKNKLQFIEDTKMHMYTGSKGKDKIDLYPVYDSFVISSVALNVPTDTTYPPIYPGQFFINFGLVYRNTFDLALYKDVYKSTVKINGKSEDYYYDKRAALGSAFKFGVNLADLGVSDTNGLSDEQINSLLEQAHLRNISDSINNNTKFNYNSSKDEGSYTQYIRKEELNQNGNGYSASAKYSLSDEDKLGVYLTYKIAIANQASTIGSVTELVDYYDSNFKIASGYIGDNKGNKIDAGNLVASSKSKYGEETMISQPQGYDRVYITIPDNAKTRMADGEKLYVYITLQMKNPTSLLTTEGNNLLNNQTYSSYNYVEINGYKSYDSKDGNSTPGLVDIDSQAGNFNLNTYVKGQTQLEDDEDLAPAVIFVSYENRVLNGTVFEDTIDSINDAEKTIATANERKGDGIYSDNDVNINGVKVQLLEIKNGKLELRAETTTDENGNYQFDSYIPGDYVIRYIYGSDDNTALTINNENYKGLNEKSYNGQDYHSTIRFDNGNVANTIKDENGNDIILTSSSNNGYWYADNSKRLSDATDLASRRDEVIKYSKEIVNYRAEVLDSYKSKQVDRDLVDELENNTNMCAYTHIMNVEVENAKVEHTYEGEQNPDNYIYIISNVDFGISERARNTLQLTKNVTKLKLVAADNQVLAEGNVDEEGNVNIISGNVKWIPNKLNKNGQGKVYIDMDNELLHGAKLEVKYNITVKNQSESDIYNNQQVKTKVLGLVDYVSNNYTFDPNLNTQWSLVNKDELQKDDNYERLVNKSIDLSTLQNIVVANDSNAILKASLAPNEEVSTEIVLTKLISDTEDDTEQLYFDNSVEILKTTNDVGRDDFRSLVGNFNPLDVDGNTTQKDKPLTNATTEADSSIAERVAIIPPTGSTATIVPYIVTFVTAIGVVVLVVINKKNRKSKIKLLNK